MRNAGPAPHAPAGPDHAPGHGHAVLIIDDESTLATNIAVYLERLGWTTRVAGSAEEGLDLQAEFRPDVVLLDHNLPGMNGLAALAKLREADPGACVVMMTGYGSTDLAVTALRQGAADYLGKPLVLGELRLLLERLTQRHRLERAVDYYRGKEAGGSQLEQIVGESEPVRQLRQRIASIHAADRALTDGDLPTVLILGETGTGKELVARALHYGGSRADRPFVEINCGALPQQLVEAELFGYERGAFTDARQRKPGLVEAADGGTLFLDEIGEADPATQVKLLKLIEDRRYRRLGSVREQRASVRIVAATNQRLEQMVQAGRFRADLYFRLRIVELTVPPLRERGDDVLLLSRHFLRWHAGRYRRTVPELGAQAQARLSNHPWPGNVRELRNAMEQALLLARGNTIGDAELASIGSWAGSAAPSYEEDDLNLERAERRLIDAALQRSDGNVTHAARLLGISRDTLRYRLERLQIKVR